ncbi:Uncharacterized protein P3T76_004056 [Phytophthora citrophthora]|uniref:SCP domain-containing protein n=1 Tax=Phytophthora citrophthora TaxID=4793 RepID=A0AAD9GSB5_9STRA|nr:Uncharacterized protein P3T76_004056 [Phytophthora citrophthora]
MTIAQSSLALLLIVAAASNTEASYLRKLGGTTIATNVNTYTAYDDYASAMLAAVNKQRATKGLKALCLNKKLHTAAQRHSDDMAAKDYMAHDGSDGSTMSERITQAGYDWNSVAENVAAGQIDVDAVMVAWINSPEHLENIMGDYTMFGSAYAFNKAGTYQHYWTQDFGSGDAEQCDGATTSGSTTIQDATQNVDQVQGEAETEAPTPAPTTVTVTEAPATEAPATEAPATEAPVTPAPTTSTPETPAQADCQSNF